MFYVITLPLLIVGGWMFYNYLLLRVELLGLIAFGIFYACLILLMVYLMIWKYLRDFSRARQNKRTKAPAEFGFYLFAALFAVLGVISAVNGEFPGAAVALITALVAFFLGAIIARWKHEATLGLRS